ncbi:MAG: M2 family metallopeptidase [Candidatus Brocadiae bacterium]|nr:M2 family metallopeptidase [Candidatus Brocadiia bacterium]
MIRWSFFLLSIVIMSTLVFATEESLNEQAKVFIEEHLKKVQPLYKEMNKTYWEATGTGKQELYDKAAEMELQYRKVYTDKKDFALVKSLHESKKIDCPILKRQIELLHLEYLSNQIDEELLEKIVKMGSALEAKFNTHRGVFEGNKVADNDLAGMLKNEKDSSRRKAAWEACKTVGELVAKDVIDLVKLRNEAAKKLGFSNYYEMSMELAEQNSEDIARIFQDLAVATQKPFEKMKKMIDEKLAASYGISPENLMPYHYQDQFFQEVQNVGGVDMDEYLKDKNVRLLVEKFYNSMGLQVTEMLNRSDLYEKEGKYQHAYCTDIDREGDVRTMCSLKNNRYWLETLLHELGHGVYSMYIDKKLPWLLREDAHTFTTEAIAMMFEVMTTNPEWLKEAVGIPAEIADKWKETLEVERKMNLLIFCRWSLVMVNFERELYKNPDQDLNKLWWDYVEKYQLVKRVPDRNKPDWAAKIHLATVPVYYHNYMLGNLLVSQLMHYMANKILNEKDIKKVTFISQPKVGQYLKERVFGPGKSVRWEYMIFNATDELLNPKYFALDVE